MENSSKEISGLKWLENAISDNHIKLFDYSEFNGKEKINDSVTSFVYKSEWTTCGLIVALKSIKFDIEEKDMKPFAKEHTKNILVHDNKIMISDFCLSKLMTSDLSCSNSAIDGMPSFIDPQCFKDPTYKRTTKSDIYSYGVVLWEISSGHKPFPDLKRIQIAIQVNIGKRENPIDGTPHEYAELYTKCWDDDPVKRPEMEEIIKFFDPYIAKPIKTHVNTQNPLGELLEEAISEKTITFYNYDEFDDHREVIVEEEFSSVYESKWKPHELIITLKQLSIAIEIAEGLEYLHKNDISHHDLNSKIILVCKEEKMVIAGFGIPEHANKASISTSIVRGMAAYIEPQCLKDQYYERDMRSDIYSLGVILWEISSGKPPYKSFQDAYQTIFHVNDGGREEPVDGTNPEYVKLYKLCWDEDPAKRPDIKSVLETLNKLNKID
ncbi:kinase-like protein [Gigaspora margarita]|uniref:Kinase-like protein n=1 Tax=Gigaspora margarita TaxID=4874 RepID=A0A8H3X6D7_GIGMA|nr:kinase-like protein [Gigaspora margarita]